MAVKIVMTCCDRLGRRLEQREVHGALFRDTLDERLKVMDHFKKKHAEPDGSEPFIFTDTRNY